MRLGFACPHCKARAKGQKTKVMSALTMEVTYRCERLECGHVFVVVLEAVRTLSPPACPDPDVRLPLSEHVRRQDLQDMLTRPPVPVGNRLPKPPASSRMRADPHAGLHSRSVDRASKRAMSHG